MNGRGNEKLRVAWPGRGKERNSQGKEKKSQALLRSGTEKSRNEKRAKQRRSIEGRSTGTTQITKKKKKEDHK